ncbi:hypothetical protein GGX14DRAFT_588250 [Mycena pura]|uniref:Uncharacterized protein n=1 Tax=Mycena pura TaxID=153505 RepID=A0AAD6UW88_9AGAR|nr:hypothetical protein GGX14DRAFT_588250 [Mycena pura]
MNIAVPLAAPPTKLGYYRVLSPNAGVRVSPLQLGAMTIGDKWEKQGFVTRALSISSFFPTIHGRRLGIPPQLRSSPRTRPSV